MGEGLQIFSGTAHPALSEAIARYVGIQLGAIEIGRFSNGETRVSVLESVRGQNVFVIQPTCHPANDTLMELLIVIDALKRASALRVNAVIPFYGYSRQDRKLGPREPITAKLVANLLTVAGADRVVTVDLHAGQIQGFFDVPVDHLTAVPIIAEYIRSLGLERATIVSPDSGGVARARELSNRLGVGLAIIDKRRSGPNQIEEMNVIGDVQDRDVVIIDDMIDTAGTICMGAVMLKERGARRVYAACTHPVLSGAAVERLAEAPFEEIIVSDTIPLPPGAQKLRNLRVLSVAPLIGEAILRIHEHHSVSKLFN
ncbi:MAG: ribose-phosphate pyrophosphokinase [Clostridia bacterium]|nr:ribose-phosphate pyrophosphokinase [Clostridia bacterium]